MLHKKSMLATLACTVAAFALGAGAASAGEVTGSGKATSAPVHANSICAFSGHNDDPTAPLDGSGPNGPGGTSQSFGQTVKLNLVDPHAFNPGDACGPGSNPDRRP